MAHLHQLIDRLIDSSTNGAKCSSRGTPPSAHRVHRDAAPCSATPCSCRRGQTRPPSPTPASASRGSAAPPAPSRRTGRRCSRTRQGGGSWGRRASRTAPRGRRSSRPLRGPMHSRVLIQGRLLLILLLPQCASLRPNSRRHDLRYRSHLPPLCTSSPWAPPSSGPGRCARGAPCGWCRAD